MSHRLHLWINRARNGGGRVQSRELHYNCMPSPTRVYKHFTSQERLGTWLVGSAMQLSRALSSYVNQLMVSSTFMILSELYNNGLIDAIANMNLLGSS